MNSFKFIVYSPTDETVPKNIKIEIFSFLQFCTLSNILSTTHVNNLIETSYKALDLENKYIEFNKGAWGELSFADFVNLPEEYRKIPVASSDSILLKCISDSRDYFMNYDPKKVERYNIKKIIDYIKHEREFNTFLQKCEKEYKTASFLEYTPMYNKLVYKDSIINFDLSSKEFYKTFVGYILNILDEPDYCVNTDDISTIVKVLKDNQKVINDARQNVSTLLADIVKHGSILTAVESTMVYISHLLKKK